MKLLTKDIINNLPGLYTQENEKERWIYCKLFDLTGSWTWCAPEGEEMDNNNFLFFGFVIGFDA